MVGIRKRVAARIRRTRARLRFQDRWLSEGVYFTTAEYIEHTARARAVVGQRDAALEAALRLAEKLRTVKAVAADLSEQLLAAKAMLRRVSNAVNEGAIYQSDPVITAVRELLREITPGTNQGGNSL